MVDVGGDRGALVLMAGTDRLGLEVEIHPVDAPGQVSHVWVLARQLGSSVVEAAVFPSLAAGDYVVHAPDGSAGERVHVAAGEVTTWRWA